MKYTCSIEINGSKEKIAALWANEAHFKDWQDGFIEIHHINGRPESKGAQAYILFKQGKKEIELLETIIYSNLPEEKLARYEHVHMTNTQHTRFETISPTQTRFISEVEYTEFKGTIVTLMANLFPRMFKNQSEKWMRQFKIFAEQHVNNNG